MIIHVHKHFHFSKITTYKLDNINYLFPTLRTNLGLKQSFDIIMRVTNLYFTELQIVYVSFTKMKLSVYINRSLV